MPKSDFTGGQIRDETLTGADVLDGSINEVDLSAGIKAKLNNSAPASMPGASILIPFYLFPTSVYTNTVYNNLIALLKRYKTVPVYIVTNPSNGFGTVTVTDANYTAAIKRLRGAGAKILGYLDSNVGANTTAQILAQAATYTTFYPTTPMDGWFIDRMTNSDTQPPVDTLAAVTSALHLQGAFPIVGNVGSATPERYFLSQALDVIIIHENITYPSQATLQGDLAGGNSDYDARKRGAIVYTQAYNIANVELLRQYVGMIYTTTANTPNQYSTISPDIELLLQSVVSSQASGLTRKLDPTNAGYIAPAVLGTGTPTASTYLNGVGTWATVAGSSSVSVVTVTGAYTALTTDSIILGNATTASFSILLPTAVGVAGKTYTIKKLDATVNTITLTTTSAQTIDGGTTAVMRMQYLSLTLVSDGANWQVI